MTFRPFKITVFYCTHTHKKTNYKIFSSYKITDSDGKQIEQDCLYKQQMVGQHPAEVKVFQLTIIMSKVEEHSKYGQYTAVDHPAKRLLIHLARVVLREGIDGQTHSTGT